MGADVASFSAVDAAATRTAVRASAVGAKGRIATVGVVVAAVGAALRSTALGASAARASGEAVVAGFAMAFVVLLAAEKAAAVDRRRDRRHHSRIVGPVKPRESPLGKNPCWHRRGS